MAKGSNKSLNSVLILSLLILVSIAESRMLFVGTGGKKSTTPECVKVVGVESGATCFDIAQKFHLTTEFFNSINPNMDCDELFVGQWVCVAGTA